MGRKTSVIQGITEIQKELAEKKKDLFQNGDLHACVFGPHLYQPLFHVRRGGKIQVLPVALNESEYQFVQDLEGILRGPRGRVQGRRNGSYFCFAI